MQRTQNQQSFIQNDWSGLSRAQANAIPKRVVGDCRFSDELE
jgi:hypothetical protein